MGDPISLLGRNLSYKLFAHKGAKKTAIHFLPPTRGKRLGWRCIKDATQIQLSVTSTRSSGIDRLNREINGG